MGGGGAGSRRKALKLPLTGAEKAAVRRYVEGVAATCGVELPPPDLDVAEVLGGSGRMETASASLSALKINSDCPNDVRGDSGESPSEGGMSDDEAEAAAMRVLGSPGEEDFEAAGGLSDGACESRKSSSCSEQETSRAGSSEAVSSASSDDEDDMLLRLAATAKSRQPACEGHATERQSEFGTPDESSTKAATQGVPDTSLSAKFPPAGTELHLDSSRAARRCVTVGLVGHPNVGKTSLLNALVGRKVASVSHTPGHTKHLQSWQLTPHLEVLDCPGLVFPVGGSVVAGKDVAPRHVYETCGLYPIAQVPATIFVDLVRSHQTPVLRVLFRPHQQQISVHSSLEAVSPIAPAGTRALLRRAPPWGGARLATSLWSKQEGL